MSGWASDNFCYMLTISDFHPVMIMTFPLPHRLFCNAFVTVQSHWMHGFPLASMIWDRPIQGKIRSCAWHYGSGSLTLSFYVSKMVPAILPHGESHLKTKSHLEKHRTKYTGKKPRWRLYLTPLLQTLWSHELINPLYHLWHCPMGFVVSSRAC